jgi:hypothetical protein
VAQTQKNKNKKQAPSSQNVATWRYNSRQKTGILHHEDPFPRGQLVPVEHKSPPRALFCDHLFSTSIFGGGQSPNLQSSIFSRMIFSSSNVATDIDLNWDFGNDLKFAMNDTATQWK